MLPILPNCPLTTRATGSEAGQADITTWLEGLTLLAENTKELKYKDGSIILEAPDAPALLELKMGAMRSKLFWNVLAPGSRPKIASSLKEMPSLFAQSVYTVRNFQFSRGLLV